MNSEYGQSSSKENSVEQRKSMEELKRMNQPSSAPANTPPAQDGYCVSETSEKEDV